MTSPELATQDTKIMIIYQEYLTKMEGLCDSAFIHT